MAALAYVLLPISGIAAFSLGSTVRVRAHGLQAIFLGLVWPLALYAGSFVGAFSTQAVFAGGAAAGVILLGGAALGRDPRIPMIGRFLWDLAGGKDRS